MKCPFYVSDRYATKKAAAEAEKNPSADVKVMTCCECAKIVPPSKGSRAFLYENYCATDDWEFCSLAQVMSKYYEEK